MLILHVKTPPAGWAEGTKHVLNNATVTARSRYVECNPPTA